MKTIELYSNGSLWVELTRDGKRFLVKGYDDKKVFLRRWFRNIERATSDFVDVCGIDSEDIKKFFHSENKGGEN